MLSKVKNKFTLKLIGSKMCYLLFLLFGYYFLLAFIYSNCRL